MGTNERDTMTTITAHGKTYTVAEAKARVATLQAENDQYGASDGRVTEINAIEAALPAMVATVAREEVEAPCEHPACYILHRRFLNTDFKDGWHVIESVNPATDRVTVTTETRYHMAKSIQWSVVVDGYSVEVFDTKREAVAHAAKINSGR